jgi:hypothetical protein
MAISTWIGFVGVGLLLITFFLSLFKYICPDCQSYVFLNMADAGLSCYASILIRFTPFTVRESVWCVVALASLIKKSKPA